MLSRLPIEVNPYRLIEQRRQVSGALPVSQLTRLEPMLESQEGVLNVELSFDRNDVGRPVIQGAIQGQLVLRCERCSDALNYDFASEVDVVLVKSDAEAERLADGYDTWLVEDERIFIQDFVEDEVLLALPLVVKHESCQPARPLIEALPEDVIEEQEKDDPVEDNPFALLKDWKKDA
jgi:uncharacterized protein